MHYSQSDKMACKRFYLLDGPMPRFDHTNEKSKQYILDKYRGTTNPLHKDVSNAFLNNLKFYKMDMMGAK